jgi:predicted O-methyltransferase YrrM
MESIEREKIYTVAQYIDLEQRFSKVEGWLSGLEGYALMLLAANGPGSGEIVEIGSWMGRSTCWLAYGSKSRFREKVHAVDPFDGGAELGRLDVIKREGTTYFAFVDNLTRQGLFDYVDPIVARSAEAVKKWAKPIRLLLIDGEHTYAAVKQDFELWTRFLVAGGVVAFDDVTGQYPDLVRYYEELMAGSKEFREILRVGKMKFIQRVAVAQA